jgi:hypothetical protein
VTTGDLAIVACYFNPIGCASKLANFARFRERIAAWAEQAYPAGDKARIAGTIAA